MSGQKVNFNKSKLYCSPNIARRDSLVFSNICGMALSDNLGTYLGVPLVHGRFNKSHCNFIVDKVQKRLSGWKAKCLSLAGRCVLVQVVSSTIPVYVMQTMTLPISVCDKIDKINQNFLWGDTGTDKKVHLANWNMVCRPKKLGGLGIRKCVDNNKAISAKLGWKLMTERNPLWIKTLKAKYRADPNPLSWEKKGGRIPCVELYLGFQGYFVERH